MARRAESPGVGRGHGVRIKRPQTCPECGAAFEAVRNDARCLECRRKRLDKRTRDPGVGLGHGVRIKRARECPECGAAFEAVRSDARCPKCRRKQRQVVQRRRDRKRERRVPCPDCGQWKAAQAARCKACWAKTQRGPASPSWKGGRIRHAAGYILVRVGERYQMEHRLVWEQAHGPIPDGWVVHHLNGDKADNRIENLFAVSQEGHRHRERVAEPYIVRIRELEAELARLKE